MARRTSKNIQPAPMTIALQLPVVLPGATFQETCDLSQIASIINRRFYRQGLNWAVGGFKFISDQNFRMFLKKLPNTWVTSNAWEKAFRAWNKQQMDMIEESGAESAVARFRDFKIHADTAHVDAGFAGNLLPYDGFLGTPYVPGEWESSEIVVPNSGAPGVNLEYKLHMVGINQKLVGTASRGIIEGYADSRAYPHSPDPVSPAIDSTQNWMSQMFDVGDNMSLVVDNATDRNDELPYPQVDYPGGETQAPNLQLHDFVTQTSTSLGAMSYAKGGNFPCGLVRFTGQNDGTGNMFLSILIDLVPGHHRGYLAEPMTEM